MLKCADGPSEQPLASRGVKSSIPSLMGGDQRRECQTSVSKNMNFAPPVRKAMRMEGSSTPGQKKHTGRGVIVMSHTIA